MEELTSITVAEDRIKDCRDVIEPELRGLILSGLHDGFSPEEVLIAISELVSQEFASVVQTPSVH